MKATETVKARPTETWLVAWTAIVSILAGLGVVLPPGVTAGVATLVGLGTTYFASRKDGWGYTSDTVEGGPVVPE